MPARSRPVLPAALLAAGLGLALGACDGEEVYPIAMQDGRYAFSPGVAFVPVDEARLRATTARLDRAGGTFVITLPDGAQQTLAVAFRPRSQWAPDCVTMSGHALEEIADLSPAPLVIDGHAFQTPLIYAVCWHGRIILADRHHSQDLQGEAPSLVLDLL